jgi:hypothetical protein
MRVCWLRGRRSAEELVHIWVWALGRRFFRAVLDELAGGHHQRGREIPHGRRIDRVRREIRGRL